MIKHSILKVFLLFQIIQCLSFAGTRIPDLPPKDKEELDGSESETKRRRVGDDDEDSMENEDFAWELLQVIRGGNLARATELLATYPEGARALLGATYADHPVEVEAQKGNLEAVVVLLELAKLNPELEALLIPDPRENPERRTALHDAVEGEYFRVVELLLASPFADRFYVYEDTLMPLNYSQLLMGCLVPSNPKHVAHFAQRVLMRRLIMRYRPAFAEMDIVSATAPVEVAFLDADMPRLRQLLLQGTPVNLVALEEMLLKIQRIKSADEFNDFYMDHMAFMSQFAALTREVETGAFAEAMLTAQLQNFPDAPPELLGYLARDIAIRFEAVQRAVTGINELWDEYVQVYRLGQIRRFTQVTPTGPGVATTAIIALLVRGLK